MKPLTVFKKLPDSAVDLPLLETGKRRNMIAKIVLSAALATSVAVPTLTVANAAEQVSEYHTVKKGETMYSIAKKHGIVVEQLMDANFTTSSKIIVGQKLAIPHKTQPWQGNQEHLTSHLYQVVKGDTLYGISKRMGTTVTALKELNNLKSDLIRIGQYLIVYPDNGVMTKTKATYVVKSGDTKFGLKKKFGDAVQLPNGELQILQQLHVTGKILEITTEEPFGLADGRVIEVKSGKNYYPINVYQGNASMEPFANRDDLRITFTVVRVGERNELVSYAVHPPK